jgi:large subunit ribosomal protein L5
MADAKKGKGATAVAELPAPTPRLKQLYDDKLRAELTETLGLVNIMQVPRIDKIVISMGVGAAITTGSLLDNAQRDLTLISGQKPVVTRAKKSIAGLKLREGQAIGCKVTLRNIRLYEFHDRLVSLAIPRIRDFRGLPTKAFDGRGNYTFGVTEQLIFPEMEYDKIDVTRGMDITIVTSANTNAHAKALLDAFGFPFRREGQ